MPYTYRLAASSGELDERDWYAVCNVGLNPFMDLRFLRTVENSMGDAGKYWYAIFYDDRQVPVACACYSLYIVDCIVFAPAGMQRVITRLRALIPPLFKFKLLLCGSPISTGQPQG